MSILELHRLTSIGHPSMKTLPTASKAAVLCSVAALFVAGCGHGPDSEHYYPDTAVTAAAGRTEAEPPRPVKAENRPRYQATRRTRHTINTAAATMNGRVDTSGGVSGPSKSSVIVACSAPHAFESHQKISQMEA